MPVCAVLGAQWGDEGKGKIVDFLAQNADIIARFSGGNNAGHTVINDFGKSSLHLIPTGIFVKSALNVIGNGVVVNPDAFLEEVNNLTKKGVSIGKRLMVSERSHLVMPYHILLDELAEKARGKQALGTTGRGIGPAYTDKVARIGIRAADLADMEFLRPKLENAVAYANALISNVYNDKPVSFDKVWEKCSEWSKSFMPFVGPVEHAVYDAIESDKIVLLEGAQGALLDLDHGTYPYVTSSHPTIGGACTGLGLLPGQIDKIFGVFKAYSTRVGSGPFVTELVGSLANYIRELAKEFGTTTGRPRRVGWFDSVVGRYSLRINGYTSLFLTRLDVLDALDKIKVCTAYELDGEVVHDFPGNASVLDRCKPVYEEIDGWDRPTAGISDFSELPEGAVNYINRIEELIGCKVDLISTGPEREETIVVRQLI